MRSLTLSILVLNVLTNSAKSDDIESDYKQGLSRAIKYWSSKSPAKLTVDFNPGAPGFAQLKLNLFVVAKDSSIIVFSADESRFNYRIAFLKDGIRIDDEILRTSTVLPAIRVSDGATTTSIPAELIACRVLSALDGTAVLSRLRASGVKKTLSTSESRELFTSMYPDSEFSLPSRTHIASKTENNLITSDWLAGSQTILKISQANVELGAIEKREAEFEWTKRKLTSIPMPQLATLAPRLLDGDTGFDKSKIRIVTKESRENDPDDVDWNLVLVQFARVDIGTRSLVLTVSRAGIEPAKRIKFLRVGDDQEYAVLSENLDLPGSVYLSFSGQNWAMSVQPVQSGSLTTGVIPEIKKLEAIPEVLMANPKR